MKMLIRRRLTLTLLTAAGSFLPATCGLTDEQWASVLQTSFTTGLTSLFQALVDATLGSAAA